MKKYQFIKIAAMILCFLFIADCVAQTGQAIGSELTPSTAENSVQDGWKTYLGDFAQRPSTEGNVFFASWKTMNVFAGYDENGTQKQSAAEKILVEDTDETTGTLIASFSVDGAAWSACTEAKQGTYYMNCQLDPSTADFCAGYGLGSHALYTDATKKAQAVAQLEAVRDAQNTALFVQYTLREYAGPVEWKVNVSSKFQSGETVRLDYLLGAANQNAYEGTAANDGSIDFAAAETNTAARYGADYLVDAQGFVTFPLYNGGFFSLTRQNTVTAFEPLAANVAAISVSQYTEASALPLPTSLTATVNGQSAVITEITWQPAGAYDPSTDGEYVFAPVLPGGYVLLAGVATPAITVTVAIATSGGGEAAQVPINPQIIDGECVYYSGAGTAQYPYIYLVDINNINNDDPTADVKVSWKHLNTISGYDQNGLSLTKNPVVETYEAREGNAVNGSLLWSWTMDGNNRQPITDTYKHPTYLNIKVVTENNIVYADFACHVELWGTASVTLNVGNCFTNGTIVTAEYVSGCGDNEQMHGIWKYTDQTWSTKITDIPVQNGCITFQTTHGGKFKLTAQQTAVVPDEGETVYTTAGETEEIAAGQIETDGASVRLAIPVTVAEKKAQAAVSLQQTTDLLAAWEKNKGKTPLEIQLISSEKPQSADITIPREMLILAAKCGLMIDCGAAAVRMDQTMLESIGKETLPEEITLVMELDGSTFRLSDAGGILSKAQGKIKVAIPYALAKDVQPESVIASAIGEDGKKQIIRYASYDKESGAMIIYADTISKWTVEINSATFADVKGWPEEYVRFLAARGIVSGKGESRYAPEDSVTRAELLQLLYNLSGRPDAAGEKAAFADVAGKDWAYAAAQWAQRTGIAKGYDGRFCPNDNVTREDFAVLLLRYADLNGTLLPDDTKTVGDIGEVSEYAKEAVEKLMQAGIVSGKETGQFDALAYATRAEAAKMLVLLMQSLMKSL